MGMLDLRRQDLRTNTLSNPFWMTSGIIDSAAAGAEAVLFSFPENARYQIFVPQSVCVETIEGFTGGTITFKLGSGTIATNDATDGDTVTASDDDLYVTSATSAGIASIGVSFPGTGAFVTAKAAGKDGDIAIACANADVPVVYASLASSGTITAGQARVHILGSYVPVQ